MKKVCFCTTVSLTMKAFVVPTAKYLHEKCGWDVTLICSEDKKFAKTLPSYIHYIPVKMARGIDYSAPKTIKKLKKIFKEEKFDMVQYSTPNMSLCASIAAKRAKIPVRLYCQWGLRYVGFSGFTRIVFKCIEKFVCKLSTDIRATSFKNMQFGIDEKLYKKEKVGLVGIGGTIGVDTSEYDIEKKKEFSEEIKNKLSIDKNDFVFGFSGRLSKDKGTFELLFAYKNIAEKYDGIKLLIVGPGDTERKETKELLRWAKASDKVIFTGLVETTDMKKYYSAMDILVHPTYREGFGMVIQEAGALAVPVITTRIPGASEVMEENISCLLAEPKDCKSLEEKMVYILKNREKCKTLGQNAYIRTKKYFDRPIMLCNQLEDYKKLTGET
ncbi:MAG: glycosyltransferase family 4 protein [Clostridia bacterium]|nr:glycosyltransferase family 4 protein [Clostridia bacterium]